MRTVHWLFGISVALFVSGLGFVIVGGRAARSVAVVEAPVAVPVATVKQIMKGIVGPAASTVFEAVSTVVTATGTEEKAPRTAEEWEVVENSAAALIESGNLLLMGNRLVDNGDWVQMAQALSNAGVEALKATRAKSADGVMAVGEPLYLSCDNCHRKYVRGS